VLCAAMAVVWIVVVAPHLARQAHWFGDLVIAGVLAVDLAWESRPWPRRIVLAATCTMFATWVASVAGVSSRPGLQTIAEAVVVFAAIEAGVVVVLPVLVTAIVFSGLFEAGKLYDAAGHERMVWLAYALVLATLVMIRRIRA